MTTTDFGYGGYTGFDAPTFGHDSSHGEGHDTGNAGGQAAASTHEETATPLDQDTGAHSADEAHTSVAEDTEQEADGSGEGRDTAGKQTGSKKQAANRPLIRRVAGKTIELSDAPEHQRKALATLLGSRDDIVALTTAVMTADRAALSPLSELTKLLDTEEELDQIIAVMGLATEGKLKDVWGVLVAIGSVDGALPTNDAKATKQAVAELRSLDHDRLRADVAAINDLAKRW